MLKRSCDANHCGVPTPASNGMCPKHWAMVPVSVQRRIYAACKVYVTSADRLSSVEFLEAWADAVEYVAMQEGRLTRNAYRNLANWVRRRQLGTAVQPDARLQGTTGEINDEKP
ncbi:MAG: hypothetical protein KF740_19905 [Ramlibacter sp.]|nr:hypothetical protein [Ramlibacter sp.]